MAYLPLQVDDANHLVFVFDSGVPPLPDPDLNALILFQNQVPPFTQATPQKLKVMLNDTLFVDGTNMGVVPGLYAQMLATLG